MIERKMVSVRIPIKLLNKMKEFRTRTGTRYSFQLTKGAELFLKTKGIE